MQNVQNLLGFLDKALFSRSPTFFFVKKEEKWAKKLSGLVKYMSVD